MIGTIGRFRPKPGSEEALRKLDEEWARTIRPKIPGRMLMLRGHSTDRPGEMVQIVLVDDEKTWVELVHLPEQGEHFGRVVQHLDGEPTWDDVELEIWIDD